MIFYVVIFVFDNLDYLIKSFLRSYVSVIPLVKTKV